MTGAATRARPGGCHCRRVRFEVDLAEEVHVQACTCSICSMTGFEHVIVPASRFRLTHGRDALQIYRFNTGVAEHLFCGVCGIKSYYRPRSNPDGWSINARCLDEDASLTIVYDEAFDGRHWEAHAASLAHLSHEAP